MCVYWVMIAATPSAPTLPLPTLPLPLLLSPTLNLFLPKSYPNSTHTPPPTPRLPPHPLPPSLTHPPPLPFSFPPLSSPAEKAEINRSLKEAVKRSSLEFGNEPTEYESVMSAEMKKQDRSINNQEFAQR